MKHGPGFLKVTLLFSALFAACGGGGGVIQSGPTPTLTSIAIAPANPAMAPGTTTQLFAIGTYSNNMKQYITTSVNWSSSDAGIADISNAAGSKGLVTAATTTGTTIITVVLSGITGTATLTNANVSSISVTPPAPPSIAPTTSLQFTASGTLSDSNSTQQNLTTFATWTSAEPSVATVSDTGSKGLTTAISEGTATITATFDGRSGSAAFKSSPVASIALSPLTKSIAKGTTQQYTATGTLADSAQQVLTTVATWSSSSLGVATISNAGLATAVSEGTATIAASFLTVTSTPAILTVTPEILTAITVTPVNPSIVLGTTQQFVATGTFSDNSTQDISSTASWDSSNKAVATISNTPGSKGLTTSVAAGSTTISATSGGISGSTTLTVTQAVLESIEIRPSTAVISILTGDFERQFTAIGHYSDSHTQILTTSVTWHSSPTTVASISNTPGSQGLATASLPALTLPGVATITATFSGIRSTPATLVVTN